MTTELPSEEKISMENFALLRVLGKGAYGKVFLVRKIGGKDHGQVYAMKVLRKMRVLSKPKTLEHTLAERQVLERLRGVPFLVNLYYAFQTDTKLHIVMEYVRGGELFTHLCSRGSFDVAAAKFIIAELVVAIDNLHQRKVIYRDLKLENILLDEQGHVKLTDFGLSKLLVPEELDRANSYCGTIEYMSPEVINRPEGGYSDVVDWWSMGVISFELLTGCSPFTVDGAANSSKEIAKRIITKKVPFPKNMDPDARDFIGALLEKKLEKRLGYNGVEEIKNHRFLRDLDWDKVAKRQLTPFIVPNVTHELDVQNFATEFTNQQPLYSPAESPVNGNTLFRGYSYISPSVIFANNNIIGEELMQEDIQALLANSSFFGKYKLDTTEKGFLGRGSFSVVRRCERIEDGALFAVKIVSQRFATQAQREARILDLVKGHVNIVRLIDVHSDPLHFYIVMELLTGQELLQRLRKLEKFTEAEAADIMRQLVSAVGFLHAKRIVHRDLKPENILFESEDSNARLRLVDFGFARLLPACVEQQLKSVYRKMTPCFTLQYAAPEVLDLGDTLPEYNEQCDLWSLGVILYTMLSGQVPFHARSKTESATEIMQRIRKAEFSFDGEGWKAVSTEAKQLINGLLTVDPKKRLSMQELSRHAWLNSSSSLETPLQTPNVLPSFAGETFNETLQAFLTANRDGFHLMDVEAAPLMKRRGLKRQSAEKEANDKASKRKAAFETVPEEHSATTPTANRPNSLGMISSDSMMNYRVPAAGTIRETRGSDSS
uniref:Ribosomal protein S6 kinase n=1 Tax=Haemonchus contortus TaxID=6289 RepID=A0A7I4XXW7_HAECO|nr:Serine threonine protein kinase-related and Protein kinase domain containing protein [Haemonchus contortus]